VLVGEHTSAKRVRKALSREEALRFIAGDDPRPILLLRECLVCNGTDKALLSQGVDNEKTFLLARWFHCVKLPADVLAQDHPFRALFDGKNPEHLFLSAADGSGKIPLESERSRTELWGHMSKVLALGYGKDLTPALDGTLKLLDQLDKLDQRAHALQQEIDQLMEKEGPGSKKIAKAKAKLADVEKERQGVLDVFEKTAKLAVPVRPKASGADARES
jgi:hypothetical protein